jgi:hypothetical protein
MIGPTSTLDVMWNNGPHHDHKCCSENKFESLFFWLHQILVEIVINHWEWKHVEVKALQIIARKFVHEPMQIGLKAIDSLAPIDRGQINWI